MDPGSRDVRPSPIAGTWYPADAGRLAASVDAWLAAAPPPPLDGPVVAVVAPHAGHVYSGAIAGAAFAPVRGLAPAVVAVVGPLHAPAAGRIFTTGHAAYATPLGPVPVDADLQRALAAELRARGGGEPVPVRRDGEHSVEIELPFLQRALGGPFRLLPVMVREERAPALRALGEALAAALRERPALLVASTDLSHYYPEPVARRYDAEMLRRIEALDPEAVLAAEADEVAFACGAGALAAVLWAARALGGDRARVVGYGTSADAGGDRTSVVGYGAAVVTRTAGGHRLEA